MADGRGGQRQPRNPAAVSNPQSGARTDGGAGSKGQPLRVPTGGAYGEAKALTEQQQGAPLAAGGQGAPGGGQGAGPPSGGPPGGPGLFGPTQRPTEPITAGVMGAGEEPGLTAQQMLEMMFRKRPSPWIARMLGGN